MSLLTRFHRTTAQEWTGLTTDDGPPRSRLRHVLSSLLTALAAVFVLLALTSPIEIDRLTPEQFLRIPVEGLLGVGLLLLLPTRPRQWVAALLGALLGVATILKIFDLGFLAVLARPFDPALDLTLLDDAVSFLTDSIGPVGAIGAVIVFVFLVAAIPLSMTLAVPRLTRIAVRHRTATSRTAIAFAAVWIACAVLGAQLVPGVPVADHNTSALAIDRAVKVREGVLDQDRFVAEAAVDAFRNTPPDQLLTGLRGKDVVFAFVESYGRDAVENPEFATQMGATLDAGTAALTAAGYGAKSGYLTSSTLGSGSGLAHATLLSGLWIDSNRRWRNLVSSDRLTLSAAFQRAGWRTVGVMPGNTRAWPEGAFYHFDRVYDDRDIGYKGPAFSWATMPDQFVLSAFQRDEHATPGHPPLMAQINLVSSHAPWAPIPRMIDWNDVGDGSIFAPQATEGDPPDVVWSDTTRVRTEYRRSIEYTMNALVSYVQNYGDDNLVLVVLGDHEPLPIVTNESPSRDVPISIISRDRSVLDKISGWGWQDGLKPGPQSPVWPMSAFRDRFLTAYGPQPAAPSH